MSIYDYSVKTRDWNTVNMDSFRGKVLIIVNTATGCGFTPQYEWLENLYKKYHEKWLEILDFPCDQFGHQAPGSDDEIHQFCTAKYNTTFDQFSKIEVNGENAEPLFTYLKQEQPYKKPEGFKNKQVMNMLEGLSKTKGTDDIRWNFTKFLVDREGNIVNRFEPAEKPEDFEKKVEEIL